MSTRAGFSLGGHVRLNGALELVRFDIRLSYFAVDVNVEAGGPPRSRRK